MTNEVLVAVPLFIFMGVMLERSGIAEQLLLTMGKLFGNLRGGLGLSVILVGRVARGFHGCRRSDRGHHGPHLAPAMLRAGYDPKLATGVICASGTLGQIIPPSTVLIFMGDMLSGINAQVQMEKGNFAPETRLGRRALCRRHPARSAARGLYAAYMIFKAITDPKSCPATPVPEAERAGLGRESSLPSPTAPADRGGSGSILGGIATPTEAASVGSIGATLLALARRKLSLSILHQTVISTATITSMVFIILFGARSSPSSSA